MEDGGVETYVEGKAALQTFKQTLNLHLGRLINKEMAKEERESSYSNEDVSIEHRKAGLPTKRRKTKVNESSMTFVHKRDSSAEANENPE